MEKDKNLVNILYLVETGLYKHDKHIHIYMLFVIIFVALVVMGGSSLKCPGHIYNIKSIQTNKLCSIHCMMKQFNKKIENDDVLVPTIACKRLILVF